MNFRVFSCLYFYGVNWFNGVGQYFILGLSVHDACSVLIFPYG